MCDHWQASSNASLWTANIIMIYDRLPHRTWETLHSRLFIYFMHAVHNCYWWKYFCSCCCCCCYCCYHDNCYCHSQHHHHHHLNHNWHYCPIINGCEILLCLLQGCNDFQCLHLFYLSGNRWPFLHSSSKPSSPFFFFNYIEILLDCAHKMFFRLTISPLFIFLVIFSSVAHFSSTTWDFCAAARLLISSACLLPLL